ncbi:hypothetical protein T01_12875 [Trichinella spiralis]|uniref:Uncharacterized protein n=1 Tax=Trichinella spiralis TaxID=6334 RepID=A0A0V1BTP1_TRISP|nr:hypothetical protein T01_12875 [Trichinella spiralis]
MEGFKCVKHNAERYNLCLHIKKRLLTNHFLLDKLFMQILFDDSIEQIALEIVNRLKPKYNL